MSSDSSKITAILILEALGRPPEHLVETLKNITEEMGKEKGVFVKSSDIKEPVPMKENKDFYTTFTEIEVEMDDMMALTLLTFKYMPANIEIISPENFILSNNIFNEILNEITRRLHAYDELVRMMQMENAKFVQKIKELEEKNKGDVEEKEE